jgi:hypothetical protein
MVAPLSVPTTPLKTAATLRIVAIVVVLGLLAVVSLAALTDRAAMARRRRLEANPRPVQRGWGPVAAPVQQEARSMDRPPASTPHPHPVPAVIGRDSPRFARDTPRTAGGGFATR